MRHIAYLARWGGLTGLLHMALPEHVHFHGWTFVSLIAFAVGISHGLWWSE